MLETDFGPKKDGSDQWGELSLTNWRLDMRLGATASERACAQPVAIDIHIQFLQLPAACRTDQLVDTVCYDRLLSSLRPQLVEREYQLLEHAAYVVYQHLKKLLPTECKLQVKFTKLQPPIAELRRSSFKISDS